MSAKDIKGNVFFIRKDNITTNEIISNTYRGDPSNHVLRKHFFENLSLAGFNHKSKRLQKSDILIVGKRFGEGQNHNYAIQALKVNGIKVVIAESFNRIFRSALLGEEILTIRLVNYEIQRLFRLGANNHSAKIIFHRDFLNFIIAGGANVNAPPFFFILNKEEKNIVLR